MGVNYPSHICISLDLLSTFQQPIYPSRDEFDTAIRFREESLLLGCSASVRCVLVPCLRSDRSPRIQMPLRSECNIGYVA